MAEHAPRILVVDVAVVGAGPAGIAAACCAAEAGRRVLLLDQSLRPGGQIWRHTTSAQLPAPARRWLDRLGRHSAVEALAEASVVSVAPGFSLTIEQHGRPLLVRAGSVILATGARERFLPFPGWTLPGVVGVGGAQALLKAGAAVAGKRVVLAGSGPLLLPVAAALVKAGARVATIAEQAPAAAVLSFARGLWREPAKAVQAVRYRAAFPGARYRLGSWAVKAEGDDCVREVTLTDGRRSWSEACDLLCTGFGLVPNTELARLAGAAVAGGAVVVDERQETGVPGLYCAGEPTGIGGVELSLLEGEIAGLAAAGRTGEAARLLPRCERQRAFARRLEAAFAPREELRSMAEENTIVCRCEDVVLGKLCAGWTSRQAKLYTRAGMGACQGRVCGPALEFLFGWEPDTVRAPIAPAAINTLIAGALQAAPAGE